MLGARARHTLVRQTQNNSSLRSALSVVRFSGNLSSVIVDVSDDTNRKTTATADVNYQLLQCSVANVFCNL